MSRFLAFVRAHIIYYHPRVVGVNFGSANKFGWFSLFMFYLYYKGYVPKFEWMRHDKSVIPDYRGFPYDLEAYATGGDQMEKIKDSFK